MQHTPKIRLIHWFMAIGMVVSLGGTPAMAEPDKVYLTFDDGPREGTQEILDLLTQEEVPGTFFLVGEHIINAHRRETLRRLQSTPLVQIGNHSLTHAHEKYRAFYSNPDKVLQDFSQNNDKIGFSQPPFLTRLPSRIDWRYDNQFIDSKTYPVSTNKAVSAEVAKLFEHGFVIYGWDVEWYKAGKYGPLESVTTVLAKIKKRFTTRQSVKPGKVVVLMHDFNFNTPKAIESLQILIHALKKEGITFNLMRDF